MDEIIARIKDYVLIINGDLTDDDYLDFVIADVVDRALIYMNRRQLVEGYERFISDNGGVYYSGDYVVDVTGTKQPVLPIPTELERALAGVVTGVYKTVLDNTEATTGAVNSLEDNGQKVTYASELTSFISSKSDSEIFSGVRALLNNFRIPTVVDNTRLI